MDFAKNSTTCWQKGRFRIEDDQSNKAETKNLQILLWTIDDRSLNIYLPNSGNGRKIFHLWKIFVQFFCLQRSHSLFTNNQMHSLHCDTRLCLFISCWKFYCTAKSQLCGGRNGHFYAFKNVKCTTTTLLNEHFTYYIALFGGIENVSGLCEPDSKLERSVIVPCRSKLFRGFNLATREF